MLWADRVPFDSFWRKDLNDCRVILRKDGKIYAGAFYHRQPLDPVIDAMNHAWPQNPCSIRKYHASWAEMLGVSQWFQEYFDIKELKKQAEANDPVSQRLLGFLYANQWMEGTSYDTHTENDQFAFHWLNRASENSDYQARTLCSRLASIRRQDKAEKVVRADGSTHMIYTELEYMPR